MAAKGKHSYYTEKQRKVLARAHHRFNVLYGAVRSGKTVVSESLALIHVQEHYHDHCLFVGKTLATLNRNVFNDMRDHFGADNIGDIYADMSGNRMINIFGKPCYCVGANDERSITKIQGLGLGYAYCDEITTYPENFFQMLKTRLDKGNSCLDCTCNPESPSHFMKQFIDKPGQDLYAEHFTIYDNPKLDPTVVKSLEDDFRGTIYFERWILGNWVKTEGLVFPLFKRERHYLKPDEFARLYGRQNICYVIFGVDGANTNDATAIVPVAIMESGQAVVLQMFYHDPKKNGQLSNEQLMPLMRRYFDDLEREYHFERNGVELYTSVDCAAADLCLTLAYHLPDYYHVHKYTSKDIMQTTDTVNNAFARGSVSILDFGGYYNYARGEFVKGTNQLVVDLELMTWDKDNRKYDPDVPNDCADAFRYAVCTYYNNPDNLWQTPDMNRRYD